MRNLILAFSVVLICFSTLDSSTFGQSGTRSGGLSRGGGSSGSSGRSGGGSSSGGGFSGGFGARRLSPVERELLRQQQLVQQRNLARELQKIQTEATKAQRKQELIQLGLNLNGTTNRRQNRTALVEAKDDFRALRQRLIAPDQLGFLQQSFRLRGDSIDREQRTSMWPSGLLKPEFETQVENIDSQIMNRSITDSESAKEFLDDLYQLNLELNIAAAKGEIGSTQYAKSRRFVSGLANEIRSSNLYM